MHRRIIAALVLLSVGHEARALETFDDPVPAMMFVLSSAVSLSSLYFTVSNSAGLKRKEPPRASLTVGGMSSAWTSIVVGGGQIFMGFLIAGSDDSVRRGPHPDQTLWHVAGGISIGLGIIGVLTAIFAMRSG